MVSVEMVSLLRILAGQKGLSLDVPEGGVSVTELLALVAEAVPSLRPYLMGTEGKPNLQSRVSVAVNGEIKGADGRVMDGDSVILMVPSTGGSNKGVLAS